MTILPLLVSNSAKTPSDVIEDLETGFFTFTFTFLVCAEAHVTENKIRATILTNDFIFFIII